MATRARIRPVAFDGRGIGVQPTTLAARQILQEAIEKHLDVEIRSVPKVERKAAAHGLKLTERHDATRNQ